MCIRDRHQADHIFIAVPGPGRIPAETGFHQRKQPQFRAGFPFHDRAAGVVGQVNPLVVKQDAGYTGAADFVSLQPDVFYFMLSLIHILPIQTVVVMVAPVAAVAGAGRFAGLPPAVERPHARYRNFGGVPVLIAGGQRWKNHST